MTLEAGTRFGPYEIVESIGAGGMGEVYRAHDTTLDRDVAIKVLPESFADDAGRVERFEREAKTLAALNHSNIAQIYGLERSDGTAALVMELVEGPTLEDRIVQGPLPADEALGIAMQIADALEAAHSQNIVHRDLKPANIKLKADGTVKVLDFGIAKALAPDSVTSGPQSPIMTTPATQVGVILGTAAYMSPEQAKGKAVDQRTDIWAFGCVLYEMLTGQLAFGAEDVPTTLARVIAHDTNLESLPAAISPAVRRTIELCLQKDVRKRLRDIGDVKLGLEGAFETDSPTTVGVAAASRPIWRRALPIVAPVVTATIATIGVWILMQPAPRPVNRFDYELPADQTLADSSFTALAVAPHGRSFAYGTQNGLYLRPMGELEAHPIAGTVSSAVVLPTFSPDGRVLAYVSTSSVNRIAVGGGAAVEVSDLSALPSGLSWASNDTLFFGQAGSIYRVAASGGTPELIVSGDETIGNWLYGPRLLPDGDSLLFTAYEAGSQNPGTILVQSISTGERTVVVEGGGDARYVPTGHLVYALGNVLFGVRFDAETVTKSGAAVPLVQGVMRATQGGGANYDVSEDGTLVYFRGEANTALNALVWVDRQGRESPLAAPPRNYNYPRLSPEGDRIALDVRDRELDIWIWDVNRESLMRLTSDPQQDEFPTWSPDGSRIAFSSTRESGSTFTTNLYTKAANGTGSVELLAEGTGQLFPTAFVPDTAELLVYGAAESDINDDIALISPEDGEARLLLSSVFGETNPELSPDGRWIAYASDESGRPEIFVRPFPDIEAGRWPVSTDGGTQPLWARDGRELFYRSGQAVMAVPVQTDSGFAAGTPQALFEGNYILGPGGRNYDVSLDGQMFLMVKKLQDASATLEVVIVENWFEDLQRLIPDE